MAILLVRGFLALPLTPRVSSYLAETFQDKESSLLCRIISLTPHHTQRSAPQRAARIPREPGSPRLPPTKRWSRFYRLFFYLFCCSYAPSSSVPFPFPSTFLPGVREEAQAGGGQGVRGRRGRPAAAAAGLGQQRRRVSRCEHQGYARVCKTAYARNRHPSRGERSG